MLQRLENLRDVSSGFPSKKPSLCCDACQAVYALVSEEQNPYQVFGKIISLSSSDSDVQAVF